jgi:glycosyltransferase involved in cell wall biosynthesis
MQSDEKNKHLPSIYFIVPAPTNISPGQRFRFEQYLPVLISGNYKFKISSFYSLKGWLGLYVTGSFFRKAINVIRGFFRRGIDLFKVSRYDYIYLYREATPVGPPVFEWLIAKVLKKKIIYDFDDAIWLPIVSEHNKIAMRVKWFSKISSICKWSYRVSVGNNFLASFAAKYNNSVVVIPTVVDTENGHNKIQQHDSKNVAVGWTGTFSTLKYLDIVLPVIKRLQEKNDFTFIVIANKDPKLSLKRYQFIQWDKKSEVEDLSMMHIGLMPLYDSPLEKGKCGFKAIQYMSLGIPAVVSPVGVNTDIVMHNKNGFVANTETEWEYYIEQLLLQPELRKQLGKESYQYIEKKYSVKATAADFLKLFNS